MSRVEPDGLVLRSKSGISKAYFTELPKEIQGTLSLRCRQGQHILRRANCQSGGSLQATKESRMTEHESKKERDIGANIQCLRRHRMAIRLTYQVINPLNSRKILSPSRVPRTATWRVRVQTRRWTKPTPTAGRSSACRTVGPPSLHRRNEKMESP